LVNTVTFQRNNYANAAPRRTILLVEDEPFVREATCSILEYAGFEVLLAEDAPQAMQIYEDCAHTDSKIRVSTKNKPETKTETKTGKIDLVMTDMILPGATGEQLAQNLHQHSPLVLVLITSGYLNPEFDTEVPKSQTYFLAKPYSRRTLLDKIEKILASAKPAWPQAV
jgi:CheY-like chemotaxis protein